MECPSPCPTKLSPMSPRTGQSQLQALRQVPGSLSLRHCDTVALGPLSPLLSKKEMGMRSPTLMIPTSLKE